MSFSPLPLNSLTRSWKPSCSSRSARRRAGRAPGAGPWNEARRRQSCFWSSPEWPQPSTNATPTTKTKKRMQPRSSSHCLFLSHQRQPGEAAEEPVIGELGFEAKKGTDISEFVLSFFFPLGPRSLVVHRSLARLRRSSSVCSHLHRPRGAPPGSCCSRRCGRGRQRRRMLMLLVRRRREPPHFSARPLLSREN